MAADKETKFSKPEVITSAIRDAMKAANLTLSPLTLEKCKPLNEIVSETFEQTKTGWPAKIQRASLTQSAITKMVAAVKQDCDLNPLDHPLGNVRFEHALTKGLIEAIEISGKTAKDLRATLIKAHKKDLPGDIQDYGSEELKKFVLPNDKTDEKNLDKFYAVLGCGDEQKYRG